MSNVKGLRSISSLVVCVFLLTACVMPTPPQPETPLPDEATELPVITDVPVTDAPTELPVTPSQDLRIVTFDMFDAQNGWAVSETGLLRTTDGGATWFDVTMPDSPELGYQIGTFFLDAQTAWLISPDPENFFHNGMLYNTTDGGASWTSNAVPFGGGDFTFLNANDGWMLAHLGVGAGSNAVSVFQTRDGGQTWTQTYTNDPNLANSADSLPLGGMKYNLVPLDMQTAWVGGMIYAPGTYYFFKTSDSGQTWSPVSMPPAPDIENAELSIEDGPDFVSATDAVLPVRITGDTYRMAFYLTADGGASWQLAAVIPGVGSTRILSGGGIVFFDGEQFHLTSAATADWTEITSNISFADTFARMDFIDSNTGWVLTYVDEASRPLYKTTDGGQTWTLLIP